MLGPLPGAHVLQAAVTNAKTHGGPRAEQVDVPRRGNELQRQVLPRAPVRRDRLNAMREVPQADVSSAHVLQGVHLDQSTHQVGL